MRVRPKLMWSAYGFVCLIFASSPLAYGATIISSTPRSYKTNFPLAENPILEGGQWTDGLTNGLDWANVQTRPGLAFGAQSEAALYDDSTAILTGPWGANQSAWATVHSVNQSSSLIEEVEIRLRTSISPHSITGYEVSFRCTSDGSQYVRIVRWNGAPGDFSYLDVARGPGIHDGDIVKASIVGNSITAYINAEQVVQLTDSTYTSGNPGMGFYISGGSSSQQADYGFTSYTATDGSTLASPQADLAASGTGQSYSTNFPLTENPISEGGKWTVPGSTASEWGNVQTSPGLAFGVNEPTQFGDPTAVLTGTWGANQTVQEKISIVSTPTTCCHEVSVRLRFTISNNSISGYELLCPVSSNPGYGYQIVRWNGPNGQFVYIGSSSPAHQCVNGDVLTGTVSGTNPVNISFSNNGTLVATACDNGQGSGGSCGGVIYSGPGGSAGPWTSGNPGFGFYNNADNNWSNFGLSSFTVSASSTSQSPAPPTGLSATVN
jgi:hypothetical protein